MKKLNRLFKIILIVVVIVFLVNWIVKKIPIHIDREMTALEINLLSEDEVQARTVAIKGDYYFHIFGQDEFDGDLIVSGYPLSEFPLGRSITLGLPYGRNLYTYMERPREPWLDSIESPKERLMGLIYVSRFFREIVISPTESLIQNRNSTDFDIDMSKENIQYQYIIVTGVEDRNQALEVLKKEVGERLDHFGVDIDLLE